MITVKSPAKLNLILKITGKRPDGYHSIETIMQEIALSDTLEINSNQEGKLNLILEGIKIPGTIQDNLVYKAAQLFFTKTKITLENNGINLKLKKMIPCGSGMGGGSSNAVATLLGLNHYFNMPLTKDQLIELAGSLGSDTVFFLIGGRCHCSGRGEVVNRLENNETTSVLLFVPNFSISTAQVFKNFTLTKQADPKTNPYYLNDLESAAFKVSPELFKIKNTLKELTKLDWSLTGSGSTYFCMLPSQDKFKSIAEIVNKNLSGQLILTSFQYKGCHVSSY
jgi:4-diphosphocytidyl-2-C-methyl-D-erythritol kinase